MNKSALFSILALPLVAGCSNLDTRVGPDTHWEKVRHVFVEREVSDSRGLDKMIAQGLRELGYDASSGPLTIAPRDADVIVSYDDDWTFDFTTYLIELNVRVRDARTANNLAVGHYRRPSITGEPPIAMVRVVLKKVFPPKVPPVPIENHDSDY